MPHCPSSSLIRLTPGLYCARDEMSIVTLDQRGINLQLKSTEFRKLQSKDAFQSGIEMSCNDMQICSAVVKYEKKSSLTSCHLINKDGMRAVPYAAQSWSSSFKSYLRITHLTAFLKIQLKRN